MRDFNQQNLIGQLSIFDMQITKKPKNITKSAEKITESIVKIRDISQEQQKIIDFYFNNSDLNRVIKYCCGWIGVELFKYNSYITIYFNKKGIEELQLNKKSSVIPMDSILYYRIKKFEVTSIQKERLRGLLNNENFKRVIKRNGDENVLVEINGKVISILPHGWVLEFESISSVDCCEDELYILPKKKDSGNLSELVRVGDFVKAYYGKAVIEGFIVREYGLGNSILNINFESQGRKCQTAIGRRDIIEILN